MLHIVVRKAEQVCLTSSLLPEDVDRHGRNSADTVNREDRPVIVGSLPADPHNTATLISVAVSAQCHSVSLHRCCALLSAQH